LLDAYRKIEVALIFIRGIRRLGSDAQVQLISGHDGKKSLEIYQHLSLDAVEQAYQEALHRGSI
jgi:hypothetical protein